MNYYRFTECCQNNGPNYWIVYRGKQWFKAAVIAQCSSHDDAQRIADALNMRQNYYAHPA